MKLSPKINLDPIRDAAHAVVDAHYAGAQGLLGPVYLFKAQLAGMTLNGAQPDPALVTEAKLRGVAVEDLCRTIVDKHTEQQSEVMTLEGKRQEVKARIRAATTGQELQSILDSHRNLSR